MKVTIEVTQADIDAGTPGLGCMCPVALAVHRALPHLPDAYIYSYGVAEDSRTAHFADLPRAARDFISTFDGGDDVAPLSFDLDVPDDLMAVTP